MENYVIIKYLKSDTEKKMPVILIDGNSDSILEFDNRSEAENYKDLFQKNSDSGHRYEVRSTGSNND